ncbi:MAG: hypothetical protein ABSG43_03405 [Solirubrobacteraceae bacterium]|jgi:hypothetical protein
MNTHGQSWFGGGARRWPVILAWILALAAVAAFLVVLLGGNSTTVVRTVIVRTTAPSPTVYQDTQAGAVAAEEAYSASQETQGSWSLGYKVDSYTPMSATFDVWGMFVSNSGVSYGVETDTMAWNGRQWAQSGGTTTNPYGPSPGDPRSKAYVRFPDQP